MIHESKASDCSTTMFHYHICWKRSVLFTAFQALNGFSEGIRKRGKKKSARLCVYIGLGEHWDESIRRAYGARRSPQAWSFGLRITVCVHGDAINSSGFRTQGIFNDNGSEEQGEKVKEM